MHVVAAVKAVHLVWNWLLHFIGVRPAPFAHGGANAFWSGFGSDLAEFGIVAALVHTARKANCGVKGCWRFHRHEYEMDGVTHKVCRHHHPALGKKHRLQHEHLLDHFGRSDSGESDSGRGLPRN